MLISWMLSEAMYRIGLTTLYLNGTLPCVDFMDVIMGNVPYRPNHTVFEWDTSMC